LQVIDRDEKRLGRCDVSEQRGRRISHQRRTLIRTVSQAQSRLQCGPVNVVQLVKVAEKREQDLVQGGETDVDLEFHAVSEQDPGTSGPSGLDRRIKQRRLADAGLTGKQQRPAVFASPSQEIPEYLKVIVTPDEGLP
jgi:hypothetical protein